MRPFSFTKNVGGFKKAYQAIRRGYSPGVTIQGFKARCGLRDQSLLVANYLLGTQIIEGEEYVLADTLIGQTLSQPYSRLTARLYFFAVNLNLPGGRLDDQAHQWAEMQNTLIRKELFVDDGFVAAHFDKEHIQSVVGGYYGFQPGVLRKWVTNYGFMVEQCGFVRTPDGRLETFADTWGLLALKLFFERIVASNPTSDVNELVSAAHANELNKLIGVPKLWLDERISGAADIFQCDQGFVFLGSEELGAERSAAKRGLEPPKVGGQAARRKTFVQRFIRRGENLRFMHSVYDGECQLTGVKLRMPNGSFSVDCAHIRPLGSPHFGDDDTANMLSLSPTMHRLFDRGCVRIDPNTHAISLLHGNSLPHLPKLLLRGNHVIEKGNLSHHLLKIIKSPRFP